MEKQSTCENWRSNEQMNIDFLFLMKKNDGHSAGISVQQTKPSISPLSTRWSRLGTCLRPLINTLENLEPSASGRSPKDLAIFAGSSGLCVHIQFVDSKEEINAEKLASVESSWKSARETPFPKSSLPHLIVNGIKKGTLIPDLSAHFSAIFGRTRWDV